MTDPSAQPTSPPLGAAPAYRYADAAWLDKERQHVFGRAWLVAGLGSRVREPEQYMTFDHMGYSVAIVRGRDGLLRAFHNSCRHRGTRLLEGCGRVRAIRCPYHDWKYALDGRLRHVPESAGFSPPIDKKAFGLFPVRVAEALGFVWLSFDPSAPPLESTLAGLAAEIDPYRLDEMRPIQEVTWTAPCNWKAVLDNATESYHLAAVHGASVQPMIDDRPDFVVHGDHYRLSLAIADFGWRRWLDRYTSRGGPYTERQQAAICKYVLFPNCLINLVPCHLTVFQVWPIDADSCEFFYGFYGREGAGPLEWLRARATWLASRYILREDWRILERFQKGAAAAQLGDQRLHQGEVAIDRFHRVLERWVGSGAGE